MAAIPATRNTDRQPSPNTLQPTNLASNNPFRNRATSPAPGPPTAQPTGNMRTTNNPFLDDSEVAPRSGVNGASGLTEDIFKDLSLLDRPAGNVAAPNKNGPPPPRPRGPPASEASRDRRAPLPRGPPSPGKRDQKARPRGMSESSVIDEKERRDRREREPIQRPERTESEERRRRERRKEREERHRREKEKIRNGTKPAKRSQGLDIIDKLDVTGIYGQGLFHHDGPFDACNPHRNAKGGRRPAPMQAFPEGSANMALGGAGPLRSRIDLDKFHGRGDEGFSDYAVTRKTDTAIISSVHGVEPVHGDETDGLGTSTFLEGAPASRAALQRRESEDPQMDAGATGAGSGLTRKKSLVQRFRGMSNSRRGGTTAGLRSPEARYNNDVFDGSPPTYTSTTANGRNLSQSAGGPSRAIYTRENEINPFDNDYDSAFEKKGAQIREQQLEEPSRGLVRSVTADSGAVRGSSSNEEERGVQQSSGGGGGFLSRMKSLKGGRRMRVERRET
ncbi:hypothetical protein LTR62_006318 [Meristemomyces frigidus]|uniref:Pal1 cell morphology protein n=1 Tax=Meristemomyces frigidus TaxID=1508187 RepID=A0AAN7TCP2_9PEZI|nr:hypothetical protein LTR62_006318 [Meristemomyces frigidus]